MIKYVPFMANPSRSRTRLGQAISVQKQYSKTEAAVVMSTMTVFGAGSAWVGFSTGARESGVLSIVGYGVGVFGAIMGLIGLKCLISLATGSWQPDQVDKTPIQVPPVPKTTPV